MTATPGQEEERQELELWEEERRVRNSNERKRKGRDETRFSTQFNDVIKHVPSMSLSSHSSLGFFCIFHPFSPFSSLSSNWWPSLPSIPILYPLSQGNYFNQTMQLNIMVPTLCVRGMFCNPLRSSFYFWEEQRSDSELQSNEDSCQEEGRLKNKMFIECWRVEERFSLFCMLMH